MKKILALVALVGVLIPVVEAMAVGISIDAGLTPPEGRWILRTQVRSMSRTESSGAAEPKMDRLMVPLVVVHGLRPQLTIGLRQIIDSRTMTMMGNKNTESGFSDLYFFAKYKVLRVNTRQYTLGIAPVLGIEAPTGSSDISTDYWSLNAGVLVSGRAGKWGADLNIGYGVRGFAGLEDNRYEPGNEWGIELALARQIPVGNSGQTSLAPVLEFGWKDEASTTFDGSNEPNTGESIFTIAPGLKYTRGGLIFEGLVRIPVSQDQNGMQLEMGNMYLLGVRYMF